MNDDDPNRDRPPPAGPRRRGRVPGRLRAAAAYLAVMVGAAALYETPDGARQRRLAAVHREAAAECRRRARALRVAGRVDEAGTLSRTARGHDWFADAYRGRIRPGPR